MYHRAIITCSLQGTVVVRIRQGNLNFHGSLQLARDVVIKHDFFVMLFGGLYFCVVCISELGNLAVIFESLSYLAFVTNAVQSTTLILLLQVLREKEFILFSSYLIQIHLD